MNDLPPRNLQKLVMANGGAEFRKNWKVATTTFGSYLHCAFDRSEAVPALSRTPADRKVIFPVRHPIDRWISAMIELLARSMNFICPGGDQGEGRPCGDKDSFFPSVTLP